jgi:hypothetical protein
VHSRKAGHACAPRCLAGGIAAPVHPLPAPSVSRWERAQVTHGSEKRARSTHITIRLSDDERKTIEDAAEKAGLTTGSHARQVLLGAPAPRQVRRPPVERKELARLLGELGRVGGNVNQLARAVHNGVLVYEGELDRALAGLQEVRGAILVALGREP